MKTRTITIAVVILILLSPLLVWGSRNLHKRYMRYRCGTNLKGLGQAMTVYANDYDDEYIIQNQSPNNPNVSWTQYNNTNLYVILDPNEPPQPAKDPNGNWLF